MKTASDFELKGLKDMKQLHQLLAGVASETSHPMVGPLMRCFYSGKRLELKRLQLKNWIIKASSVVRSPETFRDLRNRLSSELPFETTIHPPSKKKEKKKVKSKIKAKILHLVW